MYKQLLIDIFTLPLKILVLIIAPLSYVSYIFKTSFRYGPEGLDSYSTYQNAKQNHLQIIIQTKVKAFLSHLFLISTYVLWIRIRALKAVFRQNKLTYYLYLKQIIFSGIKCPEIQ